MLLIQPGVFEDNHSWQKYKIWKIMTLFYLIGLNWIVRKLKFTKTSDPILSDLVEFDPFRSNAADPWFEVHF